MNAGLIMIILVVVARVVASMVENKSKKTQADELRRKQLEQRMRDQAKASGTPAGGAGADPRSRAEEIAARRREQIEELRRRAAARREGGDPSPDRTPARSAPAAMSDAQIRAGSSTAAPRSGPSAPTSVPTIDPRFPGSDAPTAGRRPTAVSSSSSSAPPAPPVQRRRPTPAAAEKPARRGAGTGAKAAAERAANRSSKASIKSARIEARDEAARKARAVAAGPSRTGLLAAMNSSNPRDRVRALARDRHVLRDLFVLKEVLEPPLALRQSGHAGESSGPGA